MRAIKVIFKPLGKRYFFGVGDFDLHDNDKVVVNTIRGIELGTCYGDPFELNMKDLTSELKDILRIASDNDIEAYNNNHLEEKEVLSTVKSLVKRHNLDMKILETEYTLDKKKLIINFESESRVDFRDLVRDLAEIYRTRIELRQVGSRDGAKVFGGIGPCGLITCCKTFLVEFANVSMKMAKNQNLSLNPEKISGNCGKLLCCINYENDYYTELRQNAPDVGKIVMTKEGKAKVLTCDVLNRKIKVKYIDKAHDEQTFGYLTFDDCTYDVGDNVEEG